MTWPRLGPGVHTGPAGGHLTRQGRVRVHGGAPVMLDDLLGGPGALIARSAASLAGLPREVRSSLGDLGVGLVALSGPEAPAVTIVEDPDGVYAAWLDGLAADVVLVRPDFSLYGAGGGGAAADLATGFLARLGAPEPVTVG